MRHERPFGRAAENGLRPLAAGLALAREESTTPTWFALRLSSTTFGVFDAFHDEEGCQARLAGPIARALVAEGPELFASAPSIQPIDVLGLKNTGAV